MMATDHPELIQGFGAVARADARVLILGSMPGQASLRQVQYYAHPRNSFWYIMGQLFGAGPELAYEQRLVMLQAHRIALWDVVHRCVRKGSLDTAIAPDTVEANDFNALFSACPLIGQVFFNGQMAATLYRRLVQPSLSRTLDLQYHTLPSTSPARANLDRDQKLQQWSATIQAALQA